MTAVMPARDFHPGMGKAVASRTVLRPGENWGDVAERVSLGNSLLHPTGEQDREDFRNHLRSATILMSGRHLQHGDENQPSRNMEVFTNCSTAAVSFALFYLLLNGSGVGRSYDDDLMLVDWDHSPNLRCVLDENHADFIWGQHESLKDAKHKYGKGERVIWFEVPDSREGWAQAIELYETLTFQKAYRDHLLVLDFSKVRPKGAPIGGMQDRPSSGPVPMMNALHKIATIKGAGLPKWFQTMYVDHYLAEPVLVGGARRAARMSVKIWTDKSVLDFIRIKRPVEYEGLDMEDVIALRAEYVARGETPPFPFLWSSNNSVGVTKDFWRRLALEPGDRGYNSEMTRHARAVHQAVCECAYADGTGEPGYINLDQLTQKDAGRTNLLDGRYVGSEKFQPSEETRMLLAAVAKRASAKEHYTIVNPCGEIPIAVWGAYCVIADTVPYHADTLLEAMDAGAHAARALIRTNLMDAFYKVETERTNRIGVGQTGVHEFAWKFFGVGFRDLISPDFEQYHRETSERFHPFEPPMDCIEWGRASQNRGVRAAAFWEFQGAYARHCMRAAFAYADELGVSRPHTVTTIKPAGTTSKLFGLTEGWHLPAMAWYLRWVQFRNDAPQVEEYRRQGYDVRELKTYEGTTVVGFPTELVIGKLGLGDELVLASEASPEEQYQWLKFGEFFWIEGGSVADYLGSGEARPGEDRHGGQISYTLKYDPSDLSFEDFAAAMTEHQSQVRACSVMPQTDAENSAYEYLPEEPMSKVEFEARSRAIAEALEEDIGKEHIDCSSGACPVDFGSKVAA